MRSPIPSLLSALPLLLSACGGNPYGYAPQYVPASDEGAYLEKGVDPGYEEVRRDPSSHQQELIAWFGLVEDVQPAAAGQSRIVMSLHFHQDRHLCSDQFDSSCRVTISDKAGGPFSALVTLRGEDRDGRDRLYAGSLVKVYGHVMTEYDDRGGPIIRAEYYRHWPRGTYVTTLRSGNMRR
ncbi:MAG: hypothetical protein ACHQ53_00145 [Polyangiales bacterium]